MANKRLLGLRIAQSCVHICEYTYNSNSKSFIVHNNFSIDYSFNFTTTNITDLAVNLNDAFASHKIKAKDVLVTILIPNIFIKPLNILDQKKYTENLKLIDATNKKDNLFLANTDTALSYIPIRKFIQTNVEEPEEKSKKKEKEPYTLSTIVYNTPISALDCIKELCKLLKKHLISIDFAGNSVYQMYLETVEHKGSSDILIHISDEYSVISTINDGILVDQKTDNFGYSGIQNKLQLYKDGLQHALDTPKSTVDAINIISLFSVTEDDLKVMPTLKDIEIAQILDAKQDLINYTLDFVDRIGVSIQQNFKHNNTQVNRIYICNDIVDFPDLTYTIENTLNTKTFNLDYPKDFIRINDEDISDLDYTLSILGSTYKSVNLDSRLYTETVERNRYSKIILGIAALTVLSSVSIVGLNTLFFVKESKYNTELRRQILEAESAQKVYQQYTLVRNAFSDLESFETDIVTDLCDLDKQLQEISNIIPKNKLIVNSISATSGNSDTIGTLILTVKSDDKDTFAKFLLELENLSYFDKVDCAGVTDTEVEDSQFASGREVEGTVTCYYHVEEVIDIPVEESSIESTEAVE